MYHAWVTAAGQAALEQLRTEMRLRLATRLVLAASVVMLHGKQWLDMDSVAEAGVVDQLLGDFWAWYGWQERRQLARAPDVERAMVHIVLRGANHPLTPLDAAGRYLELDVAAHARALKPYDDYQRALAMQRRAQPQQQRGPPAQSQSLTPQPQPQPQSQPPP